MVRFACRNSIPPAPVSSPRVMTVALCAGCVGWGSSASVAVRAVIVATVLVAVAMMRW